MQKTVFDLSEEKCLEMLEKNRWKKGISCPYCKSKEVVKNGTDDSCGIKVQRYICNHCEHTFNVKTKTIFGDSRVPLKKWFVMIALLSTNSILNISQLLNIAYSNAYRMVKKIRSVISTEEGKRNLYGDIELEIDEMYVTAGCKGKKKTECQPRRRGLRANRGRGTFEKDKPFIVTFVCRDTKKTLFFVPEHLSERYITDQIQGHTDRESEITIYTDEYKMYSKLESEGYKHKTVDHSIEYANGNTHINNCENRHSLLRPFLMIRRGVSKCNLQSYANLFQFFFNLKLQCSTHLEIVLQVITTIINFFRFLQYSKNCQFSEFLT